MILCLHCKRLWPKGTVYCGSCGGSLGCRFCPEGHESPLQAVACTTCGNRKLSKGVPSLRLRFAALAVGTLVGWWLLRMIVVPLVSLILLKLWGAVLLLISPLVTLAFWSFILSLFVNDRGRAMIGEFWANLLRLPFKAVEWLVKLTVGTGKAKKSSKDQSNRGN